MIINLNKEENNLIPIENEIPNVPILAYPINVIERLGGPNIRITFIGMTGAGAQNQDLLTWEFYSRDSFDM